MDTGIGAGVTYVLLFIALYFEVFLLVSFLEKRKGRPARAGVQESALPKVAIVVPCYNEERGVAETLGSLLALDYPREKLEIFAVDDGSTDGTWQALQAFRGDSRVRLFQKENGGKHTAMNYALAKTQAELIGCLDADSEVSPHALKRIVGVFENANVAAVTPGIHVRKPGNLLQHLQNVEYRLSIFNRFMLAALGSAFITPGPFSIFRTRIVRELGGWRHGHSTEDMEMALRIQAEGHLIANAPGASVHTGTPSTLHHLFRQRVRWTYGFLRNAFDYRHMVGNRAYGNLGLIVLPLALVSIVSGIYFFARIVWYSLQSVEALIRETFFSGILPHVSFELFYVNTSVTWFLIFVAIALILVLISTGSYIGTGSRRPPAGTPLFLLLYGFLAPVWLSVAVIRAVFNTGVKWR